MPDIPQPKILDPAAVNEALRNARRRPGESTESYLERLDFHWRDPANNRPIARGFAGNKAKLIPPAQSYQRDRGRPAFPRVIRRYLPASVRGKGIRRYLNPEYAFEGSRAFRQEEEQRAQEAMRAQMQADLPPITKRTPEQRLQSLTDRLTSSVCDVYHATGQIHLPPSMVRSICDTLNAQGASITPDQFTRMAIPEFRQVAWAYSAGLLAKAERKNTRQLPAFLQPNRKGTA